MDDCDQRNLDGNHFSSTSTYLDDGYDCSSADINPIGSVSKQDLRAFLPWAIIHLGYSSLAEIEATPPTTELERIRSDYNKVKYQDRITLLRGNYESRGITPVVLFISSSNIGTLWQRLSDNELKSDQEELDFVLNLLMYYYKIREMSILENFVWVSESLMMSSCRERLKDIILERRITGAAVRHLQECFVFSSQPGLKSSAEWMCGLKHPSPLTSSWLLSLPHRPPLLLLLSTKLTRGTRCELGCNLQPFRQILPINE